MKIRDIDSSMKKVAVIGGSRIERKSGIYDMAYEVGKNIAERGAALVYGGLSGVMEAACRGANEAGGLTIGILPSADVDTANDWVDIRIPTDWVMPGIRWWSFPCMPLLPLTGQRGHYPR
jgi:uncharacterized protein (TIGR00725 family)